MSYHLAQNGMAGGEAVIVADGRILFAKGYGFADVAAQKPVDIERTLFRPGSISKLFTWTAVMQLVEEGKLDLDRDVNSYLDFRLPTPEGHPVTLRLLMTHRAGFEERLKYIMAPDEQSLRLLGDYLRLTIPRQLFRPGEVPAYSNWGVVLAGYIVERVSGEPYDQYISKHVFAPLGMTRSTFRAPPEPQLLADLSNGYLMASGPPQHFELDQLRPAGSLSATGPDMGRFMIAHLEDGRLGQQQILQPETARLMHATASRPIQELPDMSLGFFEEDRHGRRVLAHGGNSQFFFANLALLPDEHVGFYVAFNSAGRRDPLELANEITAAFIDRYFPPALPEVPEPLLPTAHAHAQLIAGLYESSRRVESSFASIVYVLAQQAQVAVNDDDTITVRSAAYAEPDGQFKKWREIAPFIWRDVNGSQRLAAKVEKDRIVMFGVAGDEATTTYQPVPLWRSSSWNVPLFLFSVAVLFVTTLAWPIKNVVRHSFGAKRDVTKADLWASRLSNATAAIGVAYVIGWALLFQAMVNDLSTMNDRLDIWLRLLQLLGLAAAFGSAATVWNLRRTWTHDSWFARIPRIALTVACLDLVWVSCAFHLLAFSLAY